MRWIKIKDQYLDFDKIRRVVVREDMMALFFFDTYEPSIILLRGLTAVR